MKSKISLGSFKENPRIDFGTCRGEAEPWGGNPPRVSTPPTAREGAMVDVDHLVVLTGGPGSGKTTLLRHLAAAGYPVAAEGGRAIIRDRAARDPASLGEQWLQWDLRSYHGARALRSTRAVFFDHAIPCLAGYWLRLGRAVPAAVLRAAAAPPYRPPVFLAPPRRASHRHHQERLHTFPEAR